MALREALHWERVADDWARCTLCALGCSIAPGRRGACGVRWNDAGTLRTLVGDRVAARHVDPIEKKPLFHFLPGSGTLSIGTVGCSFRCLQCQNYEISQRPKVAHALREYEGSEDADVVCESLRTLSGDLPGTQTTPEVLIRQAKREFCQSLAYTYNEPTVFFELALDVARAAAAEGLANVFVTNGSLSAEALEEIAPVLDAANVDLKTFDERIHRRMTGAPLGPVLDRIAHVWRLGIWLEVTTLVIPGINDGTSELREIARFLRGVSPDVPWHVTRFFPTYKMIDRPPTPIETLHRARDVGREEGLRYVYVGNLIDEDGEDTDCHACGASLVRRRRLRMEACRIRASACPDCGETIPGVWSASRLGRPSRDASIG